MPELSKVYTVEKLEPGLIEVVAGLGIQVAGSIEPLKESETPTIGTLPVSFSVKTRVQLPPDEGGGRDEDE
jgi:hypothetical protein